MEIKENSILKNVKVKNLPIILQWGPKAGKENIYGKKWQSKVITTYQLQC